MKMPTKMLGHACIAIMFAGCTVSSRGPAIAGQYDIIVRNGTIVDGTGAAAYRADVGITGDTIVELGDLQDATAAREVDARGLIVSPGFIDLHNHADQELGRPETKSIVNFLTQGVTTVVVGNCGSSPLDIAATKAVWERQGIGANAAILIGFGSLRASVLGRADRKPTADELALMRSKMDTAMREGAWGLSTGLQYIPDRYAATDEIVEVAAVAAKHKGLYVSHQRNEAEGIVEATRETIAIAAATGIPVHVSHIKVGGKDNWGLMRNALAVIEEARGRAIRVTADIYPYDKASTTAPFAMVFIPSPQMHELKELRERLLAGAETLGPAERSRLFDEYKGKLLQVLQDAPSRAALKQSTYAGDPQTMNPVKLFGWHNFTVVAADRSPQLLGKIFSDLAVEQGRDAFDIAADLFLAERGNVVVSYVAMSEEDMKLAIRKDWVGFSSDGSAVEYGARPVHPRNYGSFPRALRRYVREESVLTLPEAIRKMTSLPASVIGLQERGVLRAGNKADIVIFDPQAITDHATFVDSHQYSTGVRTVLVNGKPSMENGSHTRQLNGKVLVHRE